jgi:hypothetical protein
VLKKTGPVVRAVGPVLGGAAQKRERIVSSLLNPFLMSTHPSPLFQTAVLQVLKKAGRPSERSGELREELRRQQAHQCHSEAALNGGPAEPSGLMEAQEEAEYEAAVGEATRGVQDAVTEINEKLEEIKYELADLEEPGEVDPAPKEGVEPGTG